MVFVICFKSLGVWTLMYLTLTVSKVAPWMNKEEEVWLHLLHFPHIDVFSHSLHVFWNSPIWLPVFLDEQTYVPILYGGDGGSNDGPMSVKMPWTQLTKKDATEQVKKMRRQTSECIISSWSVAVWSYSWCRSVLHHVHPRWCLCCSLCRPWSIALTFSCLPRCPAVLSGCCRFVWQWS